MKEKFMTRPVLGRPVEVTFIRGEVIDARTRTTFESRQMPTVVTGMTKIQPGQVYHAAVDVTDVWLRLDSGKEMKLPFQPLGLDMRHGHQVVFGYCEDAKGIYPVFAHNINTDEVLTKADNLAMPTCMGKGWLARAFVWVLLVSAAAMGLAMYPSFTIRELEMGMAVAMVAGAVAAIPAMFVSAMVSTNKALREAKAALPDLRAQAMSLAA